MYLFLLGLLIWSCEERIVMEYTPYEQEVLVANDGSLVYEDVTSYPVGGIISSTAPEFEYEGVFSFAIDEIFAPEGSTFVSTKFEIDEENGTVLYDNANETLSEGVYSLSVRVQNTGGVAVHEEVVDFNILPVPVDLSIDNPTVEAGIFATGVIATVTASDTSGEGAITSISYALASGAPVGFTIDSSTGAISKTTDAVSGENKVGVTVSTNLGVKTFADILTVTVGPPPTIQYFQQDGTTALTNVILSPNTAYTTSAPTLTDMEGSGGWEAILPETLTDFSDSFSVDTEGKISIAAGAQLPLGTHTIGVEVTNAGDVSFGFEEQFTLEVEERWDPTPVFSEDFNNASTTPLSPNAYNTALMSYPLNGSVVDAVVVYTGSKDVYSMKVNQSGGQTDALIDVAQVLHLAIPADWNKMRVKFNEAFGFGNNRLGWYSRTFSSSHSDAGLSSGTFDAHWNVIMDATHAGWSPATLWGSLNGDETLHKVPYQEVPLTPGETDIYLNWRLEKTGTATGGAVFLYDSIVVEVAKAFPAEEE